MMRSLLDLSLSGGKHCGTHTCKLYEYCSKFHSFCESCVKICDEKSHNFEEPTCVSECQDYLHDIRYVKSSNYAADTKILQNQQMIMLVIMIIILILFILVHGTHFIRYIRHKGFLPSNCLKKFSKPPMSATTKLPPVDLTLTHENPHTESPKMRPRINTNIRSSAVYSVSGVDGSTIQTVSTPLSKRHPAEDSTLDYSYDNGGLAVTPSPTIQDKPKTETTF